MGPIMGIGAGALHLGPALVFVVPAWLGITYVTARTVYRRTTKRRVTELENLVNRLAALVAELVEA